MNNKNKEKIVFTLPEGILSEVDKIIQMENSGVKIPQEVLLWAHAQQESDVTAYEVISTTSAIDDNSSTEELAGDFDLNSLQTKAKQSIVKATEAEKNTQSVTEEYNKNKGRALEIKNENNNSYQKSMNEISNLTNEWKKLDKKAKSGQLSEAEQSRYQELSKMLGNKSSSSMKEIEVNSRHKKIPPIYQVFLNPINRRYFTTLLY